MAETEKQQKEATVLEQEVTAVTKNFTTIPNSTAEFCIYTYKAETESYAQVLRQGFFNTAYSFLNPGDIVRVFRFNDVKQIAHYMEFLVTNVDTINKIVKTALLNQVNIEKKVV